MSKKQAVVVIHGMGEQVPMQTLRSFVNATWTTDETLVGDGKPNPDTGEKRTSNAAWSKPDRRNRSYELHRITTESDASKRRTDFYEFYWAHLVHGTKLDQVKTWVSELLLRDPRTRVPAHVFSVWVALWVVTLIILAVTVWSLMPDATKSPDRPLWLSFALSAAGLLFTAALAWFTSFVLVKVFGDVVRYTSAKPENIARRQEIREKGVELLETLMGTDAQSRGETQYDRIIVVAHSLGTIVAYDILTHAFARINKQVKPDQGKSGQADIFALEEKIQTAVRAVEQAKDEKEVASVTFDIDDYQASQAKALENLAKLDNPWIVSDFITLGSPLAHAEFLISHDLEGLEASQRLRQFPTCPPTLEFDGTTKKKHFTYPHNKGEKITRKPHHGAMFAFTRWTNIYSPRKWLIFGDIVSGHVGRVFGLTARNEKTGISRKISGIKDIVVLPEREKNGEVKSMHSVPFITHTRYWDAMADTGAPVREDPPHHIGVLRDALQLLRR